MQCEQMYQMNLYERKLSDLKCENSFMLYCVCVCECEYLKEATQLQVGQPMTKLLSGLVLPSHTSSMQLAVHISHTRTWAFTLK